METWQINHIRKNFRGLLDGTICNHTFLGSLYADGIVSNEEVGILRNVSNRQEQAQKLYEIIQTRKDSFNPLKQALQDTSQSGALAILEQCKQHTARIPFQNCGSISYFHKVLLGKGGYGTKVFKGMFENRDIAVKRLDRDEVEMADVQGEVNLQILLDSHKNVVRYFKTEVSDEYIFIALELCDVNLFDWVIQPQKTVEIDAMEVIKQSTEGVAHLHSNRVIHRDLKPTNILLVSRPVGDTQVKISDFGISKRIPVGVTRLSIHTAGVGTVEWMAPEVAGGLTFQNNVAVGMSFASDVFSLGCIYYFVLSNGLHPFGEPRRCQANIEDGKYQLNAQNITAVEGGASGYINKIKKMIAHDRGERPSVLEVLTWLPHGEGNEFGRANTMIKSSKIISLEHIDRQDELERESGHRAEANPDTGRLTSSMEFMKLNREHEHSTPESTMELKKINDFHLTIKEGDLTVIKEQIESGADINARNINSETAIIVAAANQVDADTTIKIIRYLIDSGADVLDTDWQGHTFLHKLSLKESTLTPPEYHYIALYLVKKELPTLFNIRDTVHGRTPLMLAVANVKVGPATLALLHQNDVNFTLLDKKGYSALFYGNMEAKINCRF